jgi:hypothetical protein
MGGASGVGGRGRATGGNQGRVLGGRGALAALGRPGELGVASPPPRCSLLDGETGAQQAAIRESGPRLREGGGRRGRGALAALGRPGGLGVMPRHEAIAIIWVQRGCLNYCYFRHEDSG